MYIVHINTISNDYDTHIICLHNANKATKLTAKSVKLRLLTKILRQNVRKNATSAHLYMQKMKADERTVVEADMRSPIVSFVLHYFKVQV